jgi:hypothetical protein
MGHPAKIRRLRKSSRLKKRLAAVAMAGVAGSAVVLALSVLWRTSEPQQAAPVVAATTPAASRPASYSLPLAALKKSRRIYPYSIIPGGVSEQGELVRVMKSDKVVAAHYAAFDVSKVREVTVSKPRAVYVSYRKRDKVYWTANKLMLAEGETLLSDGSSEIRTRCGNRISDVPQLPVEVKGPTPEELDSSVEEAQEAPDQAKLSLVAFGLDEIGDMPSFAGQVFVSSTPANGVEPAARDVRHLALASGSGASPATLAGWAPFGLISRGSAVASAGSTSETSRPVPDSPPDTPTVLAPSSTQAGDSSSSWETQASPGDPAPPHQSSDPAPNKPETAPSIPEELLSPPPFPDQTQPAAPKPAKVPEPSTMWLSATALVALLLRRKGARKAAAAD